MIFFADLGYKTLVNGDSMGDVQLKSMMLPDIEAGIFNVSLVLGDKWGKVYGAMATAYVVIAPPDFGVCFFSAALSQVQTH